MKKLIAEFIGTLWLVLGGCGSAVLAAGYPELGIGFVGVSIAFGLTVLTMVYAIGHISGCHLNPAVSIGLWMGGRFEAKDLVPYIIAQVLGGIAGAGILYLIVSGKSGFELGGFAANGFGEHSPDGYNMTSALITEIVMTFMFLMIILGATHPKAPEGFGGIAIGIGLTLIHQSGFANGFRHLSRILIITKGADTRNPTNILTAGCFNDAPVILLQRETLITKTILADHAFD